MKKNISIKTSHEIIQILANNVDWDELDEDFLKNEILLNQTRSGKHFTAFLKNGGKVFVEEQKVIQIKRPVISSPKELFGFDCVIEEQDERSLALDQIDLTQIALATALIIPEDEKSISGEERLRRLKAKSSIRLDACVLKTLWDNQHLIPEKWKEKINGNAPCIYFDGTIIECEGRASLYLRYDEYGWGFGLNWLELDRDSTQPSAVILDHPLF